MAMGDEVWVFLVETARVTPAARAEMAAWLDNGERARLAKFIEDEPRQQFTLAHAAVRHALSAASAGIGHTVYPSAWRLSADARGKPLVAGVEGDVTPLPPLHFSLSHSRGLAAAAVAGFAEIGVDVEAGERKRWPDVTALIKRFYADEEAAACLAVEDEIARRALFLRYWTLKEAYTKALGMGLSRGTTTFAVAVEGDEATLLYDCCSGETAGWRLWTRALAGGYAQDEVVSGDFRRRSRYGSGGSPSETTSPPVYLSLAARPAGADFRVRLWRYAGPGDWREEVESAS